MYDVTVFGLCPVNMAAASRFNPAATALKQLISPELIQATYNPTADDTGEVAKVVKFATDITTAVARN